MPISTALKKGEAEICKFEASRQDSEIREKEKNHLAQYLLNRRQETVLPYLQILIMQ